MNNPSVVRSFTEPGLAVVRGIREIDPKSFVNILKTDFIVASCWYERPED